MLNVCDLDISTFLLVSAIDKRLQNKQMYPNET